MSKGVISMGIHCPIIRAGDNLVQIISDTVMNEGLQNGDVIGITESIVARANDLYVTVDEIANDVIRLFGKCSTIIVSNPIYSRNRFSLILKGIARAANKIIFDVPKYDEVGNPIGINPFTGIDIREYYCQICKEENCEYEFKRNPSYINTYVIDCRLHGYEKIQNLKCVNILSLADICKDYNKDFGLLGSNKATEEKLKLFPTKAIAQKLVEDIQSTIKLQHNIDVSVLVYGDGCFKDPIGGIWEFADPVTCPGYTKELEGMPNEIKIKAFADDKYADLNGLELENAIKEEIKNKDSNLKGNMSSQGTTPRRYIDLLVSLMDLTSGSGDKGTPIVIVRNYFNNYATIRTKD